MDEGRTAQFARDDRLTAVLSELNGMLQNMERPLAAKPQFPIVFIVGCPRSGTTLMMQWLASLGVFAYPSNLVARFYGNPYVGVRIQQALHTYDSKKQIFPHSEVDGEFSSSYGHTVGALAPSEFWYFWRRFFHFGDIQKLDDIESNRHDLQGFAQELALMEQAFAMPLAMKAMIVNWHLPELYQLFDRCLFIDVSRDARDNAESLYCSRKNFFGDYSKWYSFKPPEYTWLKEVTPLQQVAGQVFFTRRAVDSGLAQIPSTSVLRVSHEEFCESPAVVYSALAEKLQHLGCEMPTYPGQQQFKKSSVSRLQLSERETISQYLAYLQAEYC